MKKIVILTPILIITVIVVSGCVKQAEKQPSPSNTAAQQDESDPNFSPPDSEPGFKAPTAPPGQKGPTGPPPTDMFPPTASPDGRADEDRCGIENCHGLEITCGPDVPDFCTEIYQLGDFCRQYAVCETINDQCQLVPNEKFDQCVECVRECEGLGGEPAFECEAECREEVKQ